MREKEPAYAENFFRELDLSEEALLQLVSACLPKQEVRMTRDEIAASLPRWENNNSVRNTCCAVSTAEIQAILETLFTD